MDKNLEAAVAEHQQNKECARALKKLIDENFDGYRLDSDKVLSTAMNVFGEKRVELALASSIDQLSYDGRISTQNKNWAHGIMVAQDERNRDIRIDGHPGLIDTVTGDFRKLQKSLAERTQQQNLTEIDGDTAVGMANVGFHVYMDGASVPISRDLFTNSNYNYDTPHTFAAPRSEAAQYTALENLCGKLDSLNDEVVSEYGASIRYYAVNEFHAGSKFRWSDMRSEWENIRDALLKGETKFIYDFLNDHGDAELTEQLDHYETTYLKGKNDRDVSRENAVNDADKKPFITVSSESGTNNSFDVTSVGFDTEKQYTVAEFNQALKKANEKWQENWDGLSYPSNIIIVTVENLHNEPCTYRVNLTDADYNSIQDIVDLSPTPMHASISTEKAIEVLNKAEADAREQGLAAAEQDKTFAYKVGSSAPFTVVHLDISTEERKNAVSEALKDIIDAYYTDGRQSNDMAQPYKNLLEQIKPEAEFIHASQGHLECLKFALRNPQEDKELCMSMLDSIKQAENNLTPVVIIKGYECIPKDIWEDHGVTYKIGQCVDDMSFYYARATDGTVTRDYEYDHEPSRENVMSDHADKLAEEAIDRHEAEYGADGRRAFPDEQNNMVENIPQQRDISHNTTNAALPAKRGESRGKIMEQNAMTTKFEVSSLSKLEGNGAKAIGTLVVNGEFAVHGVKVMEGNKGLFVSLPAEKRGGDWEEIVFPVTKEARAALNSAVLDAYEKLAASPEKTLKNEIATPSEPVSKIYAEMHKVESEKTQTKAAGQITIDKCFVITGVKLNEGTNTEGQTKSFVAMPGKLNEKNVYDDIAHPITADIHAKVDKAVIASANAIGRYEYKGVKYAELGENPAQSKPMHPKFADKLMAQLDKTGITYQARCAETVVISVKAADKQAFDAMNKDLTAKLNGKDKPQQKQSTGKKTQNR